MDVQIDWFTFPFEDDNLLNKALVSALIGIGTFFILPIFIIYGYGLRIMRDVITEDRMALPPFDDIGAYFVDGLKYALVLIVYSLPLIIIMVGFFGAITLLPLLGLPFVEQAPAITAVAASLPFFLFPLIFLIFLPLSLVIGYFSQIGVARLAAKGTVASALDFRAVWELGKAGFKYFVIAIFLYFVVSFALNIVLQVAAFTIILLCLLPFLMGPIFIYMVAVQSVLVGKAYRATLAEGDRPAEPAPAV